MDADLVLEYQIAGLRADAIRGDDQIELALGAVEEADPAPRTSTDWPPVRSSAARSMTTVRTPARFSQKASVGPAMLAPEIRMVRVVTGFPALF